MYKVKFAKDVVRFLRKTDKHIRIRTIETFEKLAENPFDITIRYKTADK